MTTHKLMFVRPVVTSKGITQRGDILELPAQEATRLVLQGAAARLPDDQVTTGSSGSGTESDLGRPGEYQTATDPAADRRTTRPGRKPKRG